MALGKLPDLIIFDMDGLIFDTETLFMNKKTIIMEKYGFTNTKEDYVKTLGCCGDVLQQVLLDIYGPSYPADAITQETRALVTEEIKTYGPPVKAGIRELLAWLKNHNIPCCVASSTRSDIVKDYLGMAGLTKYFSHIIGGEQVSASKPDPEIFLLACSKMNVEPEHAIVLEDSQNGVKAALNGNIPVICIPDIARPDQTVLDKTLACLDSASDVIDILASF